MANTYYLDIEDVLSIHSRQIERFGGSPGILDAGLIEAALMRPQSGYYANMVEEAAALWESLTMNHGFIDGNKQVGFACTYIFLRINGLRVTAEAAAATKFVLNHLEQGRFTKDNLENWLRENTTPAS